MFAHAYTVLYFKRQRTGLHIPVITIVIVIVKVAQSCLTLCDHMDYTVHGILQARILGWVAFPFSRGIFPTQRLNPGFPHCRWIPVTLKAASVSMPYTNCMTSA